MKKNEVMSTPNTNALATLANGLADYAHKLGYEVLENEIVDNKLVVPIYNKDNKEVVFSTENANADELNSLSFIKGKTTFDNVSAVVMAWHCSKLKKLAERCGFGSVGAFISESLGKRLTPNTVNQWANVGEAFLEIKEGDTVPTFKYTWCENVPISNLALILGRFNKCENADEFEEKYLTGDDALVLRNQSRLKEQLKAENEKNGNSKPKKSKQGEQGEQGKELTPVGAWSIVREFVMAEIAKKFSDDTEECDTIRNNVNKALKCIDIMLDIE